MAFSYRYTDSAGFPRTQSDANALEVDRCLRGGHLWSVYAVAAVCGNLLHESYINPGQWQIGYGMDPSSGYGLGQWTPSTKVTSYLSSVGAAITDGDAQCEFLNNEAGQWGSSGDPRAPQSSPPLSFEEFKVSQLSIELLASYWYFYWEKPSYSDTTLPVRQEDAIFYFNLLSGHDPGPGPEPPGPSPGKINFPWMFLKRGGI